MALPGNGIFVVRGEVSTLMTAMKRGAARWSSTSYQEEEQDGLIKQFIELKQILNQLDDLKLIDPNVYLGPFLDVIRTEEATGAVTSLALSAINKFLSYGLVDPTHSTLAATVENIADAVTHAKFMGTDQASDGVTLMRVVEVLHTLMRSPEGSALTNESVCEVMLSCFKICFEPRLNELLRRTAEQALKDMVLLLFMRLPQFSEDHQQSSVMRKFKMTSSGSVEKNNSQKTQKRKSQKQPITSQKQEQQQNLKSNASHVQNTKPGDNVESPHLNVQNLKQAPLATTPSTPGGNIVDMQGKITQTPVTATSSGGSSTAIVSEENGDTRDESITTDVSDEIANSLQQQEQQHDGTSKENKISVTSDDDGVDNECRCDGINSGNDIKIQEEEKIENLNVSTDDNNDNGEYINSVGVRFTQQNSTDGDGTNPLLPYGLPCIQELFRFLILLCNPLDKQNTDTMTHMGLSLLTVAFEVGADNIGKYNTLLALVKDEMCRNLFSLLNSERLSIFAADLHLCFLLFESLRMHLKFQLEYYLNKLSEIIINENPRISYEFKELALDNLIQLWKIPGFITELYINYDCNLYCTDIFENITKLLSKNVLSATNSIYSIHILSLDALITVIELIEKNCLTSTSTTSSSIKFASNECSTNQQLNATVSSSRHHSRNNSSLEGITIIADNGNNTVITSTTKQQKINSTSSDTTAIQTNSLAESIFNNDNKNNDNDNDTTDTIKFDNISSFIQNSDNYKKLNKTITISSLPSIKITTDELRNIKNKKHLLTQGTELFNQRPDKGIEFLQENNILNPKLDPMEIALFLRDNPGLDKKMIGEFISKKKIVECKILENFVESFDFSNLRIDLALRLYLETFRLPGEAPLIFLVMEHFADHWHKCNNEPFANTDATFRLAYAIIMLNMDQHNHNAKRLNVPMTAEDFLKNLRGLNGNKDFDQDMLLNIYNSIKNEEIVMPAEQTGLVRENYLWKVLLRRGAGKDGQYLLIQDSIHDKDLFEIVWGSSLTALSFMFDKSTENGYQKSLTGFTKCATISAFYSLHKDFDALILTLCKFTTLLNIQLDTTNEILFTINYGTNHKAKAATKIIFNLIHDYGDCLRDSWKNILDIIIQLFRLKLLPKSLIEVEDFCEPNGKIQLVLDKPIVQQKSDIGIFSSLYSYLSSDGQRQPTYEEQEIIKITRKFIRECQIDQLISETKFIQYEALNELFKLIINLMKPPNSHKSINLTYAEDITVFWLEFLVKIIIQNRDRIMPLWLMCKNQIYILLMDSSLYGYDYLLNRTTVALLKLAIYLMRNEELCPIVLQSLKMLLMLKPNIIYKISKQISIGIYELLKTSAQNIHTEADWQIIFTILECVGAGALPPSEFDNNNYSEQTAAGTKSDGALSSEEDSGLPDRGYISDSEILNSNSKNVSTTNSTSHLSPNGGGGENWILVNKDSEISMSSRPQSPIGCSLVYPCKLLDHLPFALFKSWDSLSFIVRNVAHITPYNFESCVRCIRTFVEAVLDGGIKARRKALSFGRTHSRKKSTNNLKRESSSIKMKKRIADENSNSDSDDEELAQRYETLAIQLLDLMYTLYTRTAQIFRWWAEEGCTVPQCSALWAQGWCPILQGIARLAIDRRREVRTYAISCLQQRALLVHDLQTLSGTEWASCFKQVLFPLLNELLPDSSSILNLDIGLLEESRIRTATIMSKVFLHHLTPLIELPTFNELWLEILDYIEKFMKIGSDMLYEQMLEILKNMLLVMHSVRVFHNNNDTAVYSPLWELTWKRIGEFLPNLRDELFRSDGTNQQQNINLARNIAAATVNLQSQQNHITSHQPNLEEFVPITDQIQQYELQQNTKPTMSSSNNVGVDGTPGNINANSIILQPPTFVENQVIFGSQTSSQYSVPVLIPHQGTSVLGQQQQGCNYEHGKYLNSITTNTTMAAQFILSSQLSSSSPIHRNSYSNNGYLPDLITDTATQNHIPFKDHSNSSDNSPYKESLLQKQFQQQQYKIPETTSNLNQTQNITYSSSPVQQNQIYESINVPCTQSFSQFSVPLYTKSSTDFWQNYENIDDDSQSQPKVPISHLSATSSNNKHYPSLKNQPSSLIVQSFPPVYVQPQQPQSGSDIYSDYVQNPYNLTLQQQQQQQQQQKLFNENNNNIDEKKVCISSLSNEIGQEMITTADKTETTNTNTQDLNVSTNVFQSANYFSGIDTSSIPPGSEMLFRQP